ncbi:organic solute transporter subunit alpha-like [Mercenaria mercenaria]|uniref:organic solute transporter subunit alpha-like n=1 Tax=Mercenaria mercenaria TaxID=6596 RepID=UPI00234EB7D1|nr:organic solute transporter subunit alpha-like [Mercenaria mercenaria]XP_045159598.2 organic solute transporter subunit alpha-like [Mercenaria mercenaria]XP_045159599.2 organic solute transporter subunit alpha-like [Mercenaria mercenaria]XP_045159600.2 organic solute transporter subunit alpha-like [Mercenaria mercenaria]
MADVEYNAIVINSTEVYENGTERHKNGCSEIYPQAPEYYEAMLQRPIEAGFLCGCILLSLITILVYITEVCSQHYRYKDPGKRLKVLILLGIYPMTSAMAMFALLVPRTTVLADLLATCYLSLCIYVFICILIQYYGNTEAMIETLNPGKISIRTPPCCCCCCCFPTLQVTSRSIRFLKTMIMQTAILQPILLFVKAVIWANDHSSIHETGWMSPFLYLNLLTAVSTLFALYGLMILVTASQKILEKHRIKLKFMMLQFVLIFTNLQTAIFGIFIRFKMPPCEHEYGTRVRASFFNHMIITVEMFILALLARIVYRRSEHRNLKVTADHWLGKSVTYDTVATSTNDIDVLVTSHYKDKSSTPVHLIYSELNSNGPETNL